MFPLLDILNHYFQSILYCIPEGYEKEMPNKYNSNILTYEKLYFGPWNNKTERSACFPNICIEKAHIHAKLQKHRVKGYLLKGDDTFVLHKKNMFDSNFEKVWVKKKYWTYDTKTRCHNEGRKNKPTNCGKSFWDTWLFEDQILGSILSLRYLQTSKRSIHKKCANILEDKLGGNTRLYYQPTITDFLYIPANLVEQYIELMEPFIYNRIIFETALPNVLECLVEITNSSIFNVNGFNPRSSSARNQLINNLHNILLKSFQDDSAFLHPLKLGGMVSSINDTEQNQNSGTKSNHQLSAVWHAFCTDIIPYIIS